MTMISLFQRFIPVEQNVSRQFSMLRGFSSAVVLLCHTYLLFLYPVWPEIMLPIYLFGHTWVMAFFALSGFLICKSACFNIQQNHQFNVRKYTLSRLNRIIPPFYFGCAVLLLLYWVSPWFFASNSRELSVISETMSKAKMVLDTKGFIGVLLFTNGFLTDTPASNFAFWSLSFEVWFYILFGVFLRPGSQSGTVIAMLLLLILSILNYTFLLYSFIWVGGACVALLHNHQYRVRNTTLIRLFLLSIGIVLILAYAGGIILPSPTEKQELLLALYGTLCGICFCLIFYLMSFQRLRIRLPGERLAGSSYTIYILHFPLLLFIYGIVQPYIYHNSFILLISTFSAASFVMFISFIAGRYIERIKPFPYASSKSFKMRRGGNNVKPD